MVKTIDGKVRGVYNILLYTKNKIKKRFFNILLYTKNKIKKRFLHLCQHFCQKQRFDKINHHLFLKCKKNTRRTDVHIRAVLNKSRDRQMIDCRFEKPSAAIMFKL